MNARIPIIIEWPRCEVCGCQLGTPGLCAACAERVAEVGRPVRVSIPIKFIVEPDDWKEVNAER